MQAAALIYAIICCCFFFFLNKRTKATTLPLRIHLNVCEALYNQNRLLNSCWSLKPQVWQEQFVCWGFIIFFYLFPPLKNGYKSGLRVLLLLWPNFQSIIQCFCSGYYLKLRQSYWLNLCSTNGSDLQECDTSWGILMLADMFISNIEPFVYQ